MRQAKIAKQRTWCRELTHAGRGYVFFDAPNNARVTPVGSQWKASVQIPGQLRVKKIFRMRRKAMAWAEKVLEGSHHDAVRGY